MKPYQYQSRDIAHIMDAVRTHGAGYHLLYQLPTGGGKTVIFCEIAKRFIAEFGSRVAVLTHRTELCSQTSRTMKAAGVANRIVNSKSKTLQNDGCGCIVAMVESLKNRIHNNKIKVSDVGLVIIDEAHNNSFRKLLRQFPKAFVIGVTATPLSSDAGLPLKDTYDEIIVGESIASLIGKRYLAKPDTICVPVDLNGLQTGISGDYTISSSDALYALPAMQQLLLDSYLAHCKAKKTLIFNNGIATSVRTKLLFEQHGFEIKHLDNRTPDADRKAILQWFKKTKNAILTSVSILTTGFDEPSIEAVILNRATTSLTLYHQMVGRAARYLDRKKSFTIVDLGNNVERFGSWEAPLDWHDIFKNPDDYLARLHSGHDTKTSVLKPDVRALFAKSTSIGFDVEESFAQNQDAHKNVIRESIRQHAAICLENASSTSHALELAEALKPDIAWRVKQYVKLLGNTTKPYQAWLLDDYWRRLEGLIRRFATAA